MRGGAGPRTKQLHTCVVGLICIWLACLAFSQCPCYERQWSTCAGILAAAPVKPSTPQVPQVYVHVEPRFESWLYCLLRSSWLPPTARLSRRYADSLNGRPGSHTRLTWVRLDTAFSQLVVSTRSRVRICGRTFTLLVMQGGIAGQRITGCALPSRRAGWRCRAPHLQRALMYEYRMGAQWRP